MEYFIGAIKKYADFSGRARRKEFWMYVLFYFIFYLAAMAVDYLLGIGFISLVYSLGLLLPSLAIGARRLHDTGRSGWWQLIHLIPLIGAIVLLIFFVQPGEDDNAFGVNPKAVA